MNLGDAIIGATAMEYGLPLVTRNVDDFRHIPGLQVINPFERL
jgi:predicted nucleic acid-binding protein